VAPTLIRSLLVLAALARVVHAQDEFELQVYDSETAKLGEPGLEVHVNEHTYASGPAATHVTFEPHYGLLAWLELGGYFQTAFTGSDVDYAGVKLRAKMRWPHKLWCERLGLAVNFELSAIPAEFEQNVWGSEVRPIADLRVDWFYASVNPIVDTDLAGAEAGRPQFQPAVKLGANVTDRVMLGVEGYGAFGPFASLGNEAVLRGYVVADVKGAWWDLNVGVGANRGIHDYPVAKLIFGIHPSS
jgi:hypothetical protein